VTRWQPGDRVRVFLPHDTMPRARYGMVAEPASTSGDVTVIVSDDDGGVRHITLPPHEVEPLTVLVVTLSLPNVELATSSSLRAGLADMWRAEAVRAGLTLTSWRLLGTPPGAGLMASSDAWVVAEVVAQGEQFVVGVSIDEHRRTPVTVSAHYPNRWGI
jgi:hypothetical protein